jgi:LemA protein
VFNTLSYGHLVRSLPWLAGPAPPPGSAAKEKLVRAAWSSFRGGAVARLSLAQPLPLFYGFRRSADSAIPAALEDSFRGGPTGILPNFGNQIWNEECPMSMESIVVLAVIAGLILYAIIIYNGLVTARNRFKNNYAQIDVQLQRRYDLIPNLVETAKRYMKHEKETLEAVIQARNQAQGAAQAAARSPEDPKAIQTLMGAEGVLGGALGRFFALAEAYPDLKANQTMQQLMEELSSTENRVAFARQAFNDSVMDYNNQREQFPNNLVAGPVGFLPAQQLEIHDEEAREAVRVSFS